MNEKHKSGFPILQIAQFSTMIKNKYLFCYIFIFVTSNDFCKYILQLRYNWEFTIENGRQFSKRNKKHVL